VVKIKKTTYADSGVNIELGDDVSKILYNAAKQTWKNREGKLGELIIPFDDFSGVRAIDVSGLPEGTLMNIGFDGVGTKMELAERINDHSTIAYDLFAMVCDDAVVRGAEPVLVGSILDVNSLGRKDETYISHVNQLAKGYIDAAKAANVAIVNGEVAELGNRIYGYHESVNIFKRIFKGVDYIITGKSPESEGFNYNWGAAVVWFANQERLFTGHEIQEDDYIIGLEEKGFRSNGLSLVRKIMENSHGDDWHKIKYNDVSLAELALQPSRIYSGAVVEMFGGYRDKPQAKINGVVHVTGGGLPGKLGRILKPSKKGAVIEYPFEPSELMLYCQEKGNVSDEEAYKTWNMGQGMVIITPEPEKVMEIAEKHSIYSKFIGTVTSEKGIKIKNKGFYSSEKYLEF